MCVVAFLYLLADVGIAAWLNDMQAIYVFSGVYYPKVTLLILVTLATAVAYGIGLGHDVSIAIARQTKQGKSLASIVSGYWQAQSVKTRFRWKEPLPFKSLDPSYRPITYGRQLVYLSLFSAIFTGLVWASHFISQGWVFTYHLLLVPLFAIVGSAFLVLAIVLTDRTPTELTMNLRGVERKICVGTKSQVEVWLWEEVVDCTLTHTVIRGQKLSLLKMSLISEKSVMLGLSTKLQPEQLQHFFEHVGKPLKMI